MTDICPQIDNLMRSAPPQGEAGRISWGSATQTARTGSAELAGLHDVIPG
jgi:hypothetical protein